MTSIPFIHTYVYTGGVQRLAYVAALRSYLCAPHRGEHYSIALAHHTYIHTYIHTVHTGEQYPIAVAHYHLFGVVVHRGAAISRHGSTVQCRR